MNLNSLSALLLCSGLDGDGGRGGERGPPWESWFFSMWTPLQISWKVLGGLALLALLASSAVVALLSLDELMLTSGSREALLP